jgi:hypothetical protein
MSQQTTASVTARIPEWLAAEIYEIQHERRRAKQPVPTAGDLLVEAWEQRKSQAVSTVGNVQIAGFSQEDIRIATKFLAWVKKKWKPGSVDAKLVALVLGEIE